MSTNSIIIANLPNWALEGEASEKVNEGDEEILPSTFIESLRAVIQIHREIVHWVPVKSFRRIFCVFESAQDADVVKCALNGCLFEGHCLEVYFGEETPLRMEKKFLQPPVLEKNWLISPPGSPKEGWVQIQEDPPNSVTLHEDIQSALDRLAVALGQDIDEPELENDPKDGNVILDTMSLGGVQVIVQNWDAQRTAGGKEESDDEDVKFGERDIRNTRTSAMIGKTPRPPVDDE